MWGEHEIDYILIIQKDISLAPNPNEVMSHRYVSQQELRELLDAASQGKVEVTPWFKIICESFLFKWWDSLSDLSAHVDRTTIHNML